MVGPLGLVLKAGSWHLVVTDHPDPAVVPLDGLQGTRLTSQRFDAPPGFLLTGFWSAHVRAARSTEG